MIVGKTNRGREARGRAGEGGGGGGIHISRERGAGGCKKCSPGTFLMNKVRMRGPT